MNNVLYFNITLVKFISIMMKFFIFIFTLFHISLALDDDANYRPYSGYRLLRVDVKNPAELKLLADWEERLDFWVRPRIGFVDVLIDPEASDFESFLNKFEIDFKIHINNIGSIVSEERKRNRRHEGIRRMDWTSYHRINTIHKFLDDIAFNHPEISRVESIGKSSEGRDLKLIKIGTPRPGKVAIWIDAGIHAREWITPAATTWMINELLTNEAHFELLDTVDFYILASANPDGYEYTHTTNRMWRKTRSDTGIARCRGVDPNRNFQHMWGGDGSSSDKCSEIYRGPAPFSEPETKAIEGFILNSTDVNWQLYIAMHSYGQYILTPWGYGYEVPNDFDDLKELGQIGADALEAVHGSVFRVGSVTEFLSAGAGGSDDWAKGMGGFKYSYTFELDSWFEQPPEKIIPSAQEVFAAISAMAKYLANKH